jgi:hypothetical protein
MFRRIFGCDHGKDARQRFGARRIDAHDTRVRVRTAQDGAVQQIRPIDVGDVLRLTGRFPDGVDARHVRTDDRKWRANLLGSYRFLHGIAGDVRRKA